MALPWVDRQQHTIIRLEEIFPTSQLRYDRIFSLPLSDNISKI